MTGLLSTKLLFRTLALLLSVLLSACIPRALPLPATSTPIRDVPPSSQVVTFPPIKYDGAILRFEHYGLEQGLSQSTVLSLLQDQRGFLWIGTQDGLNRFDGYSFKVFSPDPGDPDALSGNEIFSIIQGDGGLWLGTSGGLNWYDQETGKFRRWVHHNQDPSSLINNVVEVVLEDSRGILWVGTRGGLDTFDSATRKFTHIPVLTGLSEDGRAPWIHALYEDREGNLWIGTDDGLVRYEIETGEFRTFRNDSQNDHSLSFNEVTAIAEDQEGFLWVGTHYGLNRLDASGEQFTRFLHSSSDAASLIDNDVQVLYVDRSGQLWIGTRQGLDRFDPSEQKFIHYQNDPANPASLGDSHILSMYEDRGGVLWIGTYGGGLNMHDRAQDRFAHFQHVNIDPQSLSGNIIFPIVPSPSGKIWIGTHGAGLNLFDPETGRAQHFRHDPAKPYSLHSDVVLSLLLDPDGTLWVGTDQGLDRLDPNSSKFVHYVPDARVQTSIPFGKVYKIYRDRQSRYWIGTSKGIRVFDPRTGEFTRMDADPTDSMHLANGPARVIYQDRRGMLWFGTDTHGLFRYDPVTRQLEHFEHDAEITGSISSNTIMDVYEDRQGRIWVATFGGGLNQFLPEENTFVSFQKKQGLPSNVVYGILEDEKGYLWLSTNLGISRFDPATTSFENFTAQDGLQGNEFNASAFARDEKGKMYFGGMNGLTVFTPAEITKQLYLPPVALTSLTLPDGQPISTAGPPESLREVTLSYPHNSFDLSFAALSFSKAAGNQYRYKLEGFDRDWHNAGVERRGSYTNLPGGNYTLHIQAGSSDGVWNEQGATLNITVVPPFWQTWPFRVLVGAVITMIAFVTYRWRIRGMQAQKMELERIIQERTQVLKRQNLDLQALYSADEKMLRMLTQDEVLQTLVDVAVDVLQADKSVVFTQIPGCKDYLVRVWRGFRSKIIHSPAFVRSQQTILCQVAADKPLIIRDIEKDLEWEGEKSEIIWIMCEEQVRSLLYIPIKVQNSVLGVLNVCSSVPGAFDEDRQRLFTSLVQRAALSIENTRMFERTRHMAILDERNRLAQELHDSAKQKAFAALALVGAAKKKVMNGGDQAAENLLEAEKTVSEVIHELTFVIQESYPRGLKERVLAASVRDYAYTWASRYSIQLDLSILHERRLPLHIEQVLYRILQEGLSNIARHSKATQAEVQIVYQEQAIQIQIRDNGRGFDPSKTSSGLGLHLIHERLESIGGQVEIQSSSGGVCLHIRAPVQAAEEGANDERFN
jgi:ligand-binding sensor domain-containing protein/signal transduction histidine kinase